MAAEDPGPVETIDEEPEEPVHAAPTAVAPPAPPSSGPVVLTLQAGFDSGTVRCPSGFSEAFTVSGTRVRLRRVPQEACTVTLEPGGVTGSVTGGGRYTGSAEGITPE